MAGRWEAGPCRRQGGVIGAADQGTDAFVQAVRMSLANAVVVSDLGGVEGARLTYGCLFGLVRLEPESERKPDHQRSWVTTTYLPPGVLWAMRIQKGVSALFIFLFGLALRSMLKLK